jgi:uncharacterized protein YheU (UPF0270 family)
MIIPIESVAPETLENIVEAFVLREGTDYGDIEISLQGKVEQVLHQLKTKQAVLVYSELHETVDIRPSDAVEGEQAS